MLQNRIPGMNGVLWTHCHQDAKTRKLIPEYSKLTSTFARRRWRCVWYEFFQMFSKKKPRLKMPWNLYQLTTILGFPANCLGNGMDQQESNSSIRSNCTHDLQKVCLESAIFFGKMPPTMASSVTYEAMQSLCTKTGDERVVQIR